MKKSKAESRQFNEPRNPAVAVVFMTICLLMAGLAQAQAGRPQRVLVLNSYHPTYSWAKLVMGGIESTLGQYDDRIELDIEYMNTKYFQDERHYENLYALYKHKAGSKQYDVVLACDNNAFLFVLRYRAELYPNVPVVFCGVDRYHGSMLESRPGAFDIDSALQGHDDVTGVVESLDHESTVEVALKLQPLAKRVVIVRDGMSDDMYWPPVSEKGLTMVIEKFGKRVEFVRFLLMEPSFSGLLEKIEGLGEESIVYLADTFVDLEGNLRFSEDGLAELRQRCAAPIYVLSERWFDHGPVVGGKINSGFHQGQAAAEMVMRILDGESAGDIPILWEGPTAYMFDYIQMKRFGISLSDLPEGSIVFNEPESFYYLYKRWIWTVAAIIVGLAAVVVILCANILRRKQVEEALRGSEEKFRSLVTNIPDVTWTTDSEGNTVFVSPNVREVYGYSPEEIYKQGGRIWFGRIHPDDVEKVKGGFKALYEKKIQFDVEYRIKRKDGEWIWLHDRSIATYEKDGVAYADGVFSDITGRKRAEEELREYHDRLEELVKERTGQLETANKELKQEISERTRLEKEVLEISAAEQRRIGQDLHDSVGQILAGTAFMSTMLEQKLAERSLAETSSAAEISELLKQALKQTRLLAKGLFPVGLGAEGIMEVLVEFASNTESIFGISCVFKCEKPVLIEDNTVAMHVYRITQEAVNNAIKHGKSKHVLISLVSGDDGDVVLKVKDDGIGVPENLDNREGMGMHIMRSRAEMIGGRLDIRRGSDSGTVVQCSFRNGKR